MVGINLKRYSYLVVVLACAFVLAACGGNATGSSQSGGNSQAGSSTGDSGSSGSSGQAGSQDGAPQKEGANFPTKPIRMVVSHAAGGSTDVPGRLIAPFAEQILGQPLVFENMVGAGGQIARTHVYKEKPDGYTLLLTQLPSLDSAVYTHNAEFDPLKFTHIYSISGRDYLATAVSADSPYDTLEDLLKATETETVTIGGAAGSGLIVIGLYQNMGKKFQYIPMDSAAEAGTAVAGKQIQAAVTNVSILGELEQQGLVKILAVHGEQRHNFYPDYPTVVEQGYPELAVEQVTAVFGPPGIPDDIVKILSDAFMEAGKDEKFLKDAEVAKLIPQPLGPEEFLKLHEGIKAKIDSIGDVLRPKS